MKTQAAYYALYELSWYRDDRSRMCPGIPVSGVYPLEERIWSNFVQGHENLEGENSVTHQTLSGIYHPELYVQTGGMDVFSSATVFQSHIWNGQCYVNRVVRFSVNDRELIISYEDTSDGTRPGMDSYYQHATDTFLRTNYGNDRVFRYEVVGVRSDWKNPIEYTYRRGSGEYRLRLAQGYETYVPPNGAALFRRADAAHSRAEPGYFSELFRKATQGERLESNNIANIKDSAALIDGLKDIVIRGPKKAVADMLRRVPNAARASANAWLAYRYSYNTTKSDIADTLKKIQSSQFNTENRHILRARGSSNDETCTVKCILEDTRLNGFAEIHRALMKYGAALTPYNLWDLIPFSFIIDWFCPVGTLLENCDAEWYYHSAYFRVKAVTTSVKWTKTILYRDSSFIARSYSRAVGSRVPTLTWYEENPSTKTVVMRSLDAASLILG